MQLLTWQPHPARRGLTGLRARPSRQISAAGRIRHHWLSAVRPLDGTTLPRHDWSQPSLQHASPPKPYLRRQPRALAADKQENARRIGPQLRLGA